MSCSDNTNSKFVQSFLISRWVMIDQHARPKSQLFKTFLDILYVFQHDSLCWPADVVFLRQ